MSTFSSKKVYGGELADKDSGHKRKETSTLSLYQRKMARKSMVDEALRRLGIA
jgi:hypothetical protein